MVVDKFTKYAHFISLKHPYSAKTVAKLYLDQIYKFHVLPLSIISDRDNFHKPFLEGVVHFSKCATQDEYNLSLPNLMGKHNVLINA
jgi:hypothetical protein